MSVKADRPQVRTAEQLERKYNFASMETNAKMNSAELNKVSNELYSFVSAVAGDTETLERQLDGEIDTWYGDEVPTLLNQPASDWNISDYAKETADDKKAVFVETQPTPPYDNGDLWLNNKKLYVCQLAREKDDTFHEQDFVLATDYVDGTQATANANAIQVMSGQITQLIAKNNEYDLNFITTRQTTDGINETLQEFVDYIRFVDGNIELGKAGNLYTLKIENDRINIYYNNQPISNWIQDKFSVSQLNLGNFAFIPRQNGSLSFRKVKS